MNVSKLTNSAQDTVSETSTQGQSKYGERMMGESLFHSFTNSSRRIFALSLYEKVVIFAVLGLVVVAWTLDSVLHPRIENSDLNNVAVMVAKDLNPTLFPTDFTFSDQSFYQAYTPVYRWIVGRLWQWSGNFELGLVWLVPGVLTVYLVGMFVLLYQVIGNPWLAVGLTVASAHYHDLMGAEVWGIGGITQIMARALFMAVVPYLALWFLFTVEKVSIFKVAVLGLAVGLAANLHPGSGMHLAILLASVLILVYGFQRKSWHVWGMVIFMAFTTLLGAWPMVGSFTSSLESETSSVVSFEIFKDAVGERYPLYFYPDTLEWLGIEITRPTLDFLVWLYIAVAIVSFILYIWKGRRSSCTAKWCRWAWLIGGLITVGYASIVALFEMSFLFGLVGLYIIYRFVYPDFKFLDWLMLGMMAIVILQSFVGYYLMSLAWDTFELQRITPILIEQFRAARFVYLPVYVLAGLASVALAKKLGTVLNRISRKNKSALTKSDGAKFESALAVMVGLFLSLLPGLSSLPGWQYILLVVIILIIIFGLIMLCTQTRWRHWPVVYTSIGLFVILGVLFGPLAPVFTPLAPIPVVNLLDPPNRLPDSTWPENDDQLYHWVRENTPVDALFFWCDFGPSTTLRFRREAQRGITHNWKDLGWATYNGTSLVPLLDRYRKLERACANTDHALAAAYEIGADYILVPAAKAAELQAASCFANDRYLVFGLGANACVQE